MVVSEGSAQLARGRATGRFAKLGIALQVLLILSFSVLIALAVVWFARRPGLRLRADWTSSGTNTLDEQTLELLSGLEGQVEVDVFARPVQAHFAGPFNRAHQTMVRMLEEAEQRAGGQLVLTVHDPAEIEMVEARMQELRSQATHAVVISRGERRIVLDYFSHITEIDPGNPDPDRYVPATLSRFRGEAVFAEALAQLATDDAPRVLFTSGHAELDIADEQPNGVSGLVAMLQAEGFEVGQWIGEEAGPIPEDCKVLAVLGNEQPFTALEVQHIEEHVARGGRLFVTVGNALWTGPGSGAALLAPLGMRVRQAIACETRPGRLGGQIEGVAECGSFRVGGSVKFL